MYGSAPAYFVGALVTGWSLAHHTSVPLSCRILLCTDDVPETFKTLLASVWTVRRVEYINKASPWFYWDYHKSRFKQVFTKLRVLKDLHGMFKKVVLLDLDLLVRGEVDSLFQLPAPAAMVRGQSPLKHGETVPVDAFFMAHRQVAGINCGVMLVEPSGEIFDKMLKEVQQYVHPEHWPSHGPEQDYLSRFYNAFNCIGRGYGSSYYGGGPFMSFGYGNGYNRGFNNYRGSRNGWNGNGGGRGNWNGGGRNGGRNR